MNKKTDKAIMKAMGKNSRGESQRSTYTKEQMEQACHQAFEKGYERGKKDSLFKKI